MGYEKKKPVDKLRLAAIPIVTFTETNRGLIVLSRITEHHTLRQQYKIVYYKKQMTSDVVFLEAMLAELERVLMPLRSTKSIALNQIRAICLSYR